MKNKYYQEETVWWIVIGFVIGLIVGVVIINQHQTIISPATMSLYEKICVSNGGLKQVFVNRHIAQCNNGNKIKIEKE